MKQNKLSLAVKATLVGAALGLSSSAFAADKELLDILKANGSISTSQYDELLAKADEPSESTALLKKMAWAGKMKIKGDLRLRNENRSTTNGVSHKGRQRYRARIGLSAAINDQVDVGFRLVTGGGTTSTNETIDDYFEGDDTYFDLAYINWQPVEGLELIGGKFKKPWQSVSGAIVWDGDLNPEGVAARYTAKLGGAKVITTAGYIIMDDNGVSNSDDETVSFGQVAANFKVSGAKTKVGVSVFDFNEGDHNPLTLRAGNDSTQYQLAEVFAQTELDLGLPVKLYGHYVVNNDADGVNSGEDTAWLLGVGTKMGKWKASYDYRDVELNSVFGAFNDSDFSDGDTDAKGSRWKLSYKINKNFSVATTYLDVEAGSLNDEGKGDVDTWQIDLKAKF